MISTWQHPPALPTAEANAAHVWAVNLDRIDAQALTETLSATERERAAGLRVARDRARFVAARGSLCVILGKYAGCAPGELAFCYGEYGKPMLASPWGETELRFNVSHSAGLALIGVSLGREIGVDVEHCGRAVRRMERIAKRFFAPRDYEQLCALPHKEQRRAFFRFWTRKEAYLKAMGTGLARASKNVDLGDTPDNWTLRHLDPGGGYVGAVAIAGKDMDIQCWMSETLVARSLSERR